ncbi:MAG: helix-turn-helix transcriptional regulator [Ruminiclostridium sp.]|nr:helix-turn-helix transcriptional regulator [Ruminiclostridium sp.]
MSVQLIAEECGYINTAHFMRRFKKRNNMSEGEYRKAEKMSTTLRISAVLEL